MTWPPSWSSSTLTILMLVKATSTRRTLVPAFTQWVSPFFRVCRRFVTVFGFLAGDRLPFKVVYETVSFKEPEAKVFLSSPITAKILEVERYTSNPDRFNGSLQRSVNKVPVMFICHITGRTWGYREWLSRGVKVHKSHGSVRVLYTLI